MKITFEIPDEVFNTLVDAVCSLDGYHNNEDESKIQFTKRRLLEDWAFRKMSLAKAEKARIDAIDEFAETKSAIVSLISVVVEGLPEPEPIPDEPVIDPIPEEEPTPEEGGN